MNEPPDRAEQVIHVQWTGPFTFADALTFTDRRTDYGVYQVCGLHPAYGQRTLLYLGRAQQQTFGKRLSQEGWERWQVTNGNVVVYLGRLAGAVTPPDADWDEQIALTERLLIVAYRPAHNASGLYRNDDPAFKHLHVLNWSDRGYLSPEVSGARWATRFSVIENYAIYGGHPTDTPRAESPDAAGDEPGPII